MSLQFHPVSFNSVFNILRTVQVCIVTMQDDDQDDDDVYQYHAIRRSNRVELESSYVG